MVTTTLALTLLFSIAGVTELQGSTYSPEVERTESATTTQPDVSTSTAKDMATSSVDIHEVSPVPIPLGKEHIAEEILEVFPEAPIMLAVAKCESGFKPLADRDNRNVDVGLFQINQVHLDRLNELGLDRRDLQDNLTYARMLYDERGLGHWYMSEHCWSNYL